jgi:RecJ-like exonuclease
MNVVNVEFDSDHWSVIVEGSDEYEQLGLSLDDGNSKTAKHVYNCINAVVSEEYIDAKNEAKLAIDSSKNIDTAVCTTVVCPFCMGDGVLYINDECLSDETINMADDRQIECQCCSGAGKIDASTWFDMYSESAYPEHVVMCLIRDMIPEAKALAIEVLKEVEAHGNCCPDDFSCLEE